MVDVHTHILPGMDDGAEDIDESGRMLSRLAEQGVRTAALTPHYYHYKEPLDEFLARRLTALELIKPVAQAIGIDIIPASETYLTEDLLNEKDLTDLCYQNTRMLLMEMPFSCAFTARDLTLLERVAGNYGITPVLAHIERYPRLLNSDKLLSDIQEIGCLTQVNLSSFADGKLFVRKRLLRLISDGMAPLMGTDCHRMTFRPPEYERPLRYIVKKLGKGVVSQLIMVQLWENTKDVLEQGQ